MPLLTRRAFLGASAASVCHFASGLAQPAEPKVDVAFFVVGDTHYLAAKDDPQKLDPRSGPTNARLVDHLNRLPGTAIPEKAGGGAVLMPRGVIHVGDLIDSGDKNAEPFLKMQQREWDAFAEDYGLTGKDGRLKYPVFEVHGNHDTPQGDGLAVKKIIERNKKRPGLASVSKNGLHYSWDWGPVHFVNLGIVVGSVKDVARKRRYNALDSLDFLIADLKEKVGTSGRPVILTHHVDVARNTTEPDPKAPASNKEWDPADVRGYYDALKAYNVIAVFYGHTHVRNIFKWDGATAKAAQGVSVFNVDNGAHFNFKDQAIFYVQVSNGELLVREFATVDRWETAAWTPQTWVTKTGTK